MSAFSHCISVSPFSALCSGLAPLDINQGRNDGAIHNTHAKHTHSFTDWAFSSALRRDRVVCLVVIGGIQPVQHGVRAGETDRERERERDWGMFYLSLVIEKAKQKVNNRTWKLFCFTSSKSIFPGDSSANQCSCISDGYTCQSSSRFLVWGAENKYWSWRHSALLQVLKKNMKYNDGLIICVKKL